MEIKFQINALRKVATVGVITVLFAFTMAVTAFAAADGSITGSLSGSTAKATLKNKSGNTRYCVVCVQHANGTSASYSTVGYNAGAVSSGNKISVSGTISKPYARGMGEIYHSSVPASGVEKTLYTSIK